VEGIYDNIEKARLNFMACYLITQVQLYVLQCRSLVFMLVSRQKRFNQHLLLVWIQKPLQKRRQRLVKWWVTKN